jgi:hypothetical protein
MDSKGFKAAILIRETFREPETYRDQPKRTRRAAQCHVSPLQLSTEIGGQTGVCVLAIIEMTANHR